MAPLVHPGRPPLSAAFLPHCKALPSKRFLLATGPSAVYEPSVLWNFVFGGLATLSLALLIWQWLVAIRFPLHTFQGPVLNLPPVTLLKPLKGCDEYTERCLRSWFTHDYPAPVQILFAVASPEDPVCGIVRNLQAEFPNHDSVLIVPKTLRGTNAKVAKLAELEALAKHEVVVISDADVLISPQLLASVVAPLSDSKVGLVNCFYRLANPTTQAMRWEAIAINADFWSQVLQAQSLKPMDFALGAVMATRQAQLSAFGGFDSLRDCLADDYQLGRRIARKGYSIQLSGSVVDCWDPPKGWGAVWRHQLRWARTIRVSQPLPYFFSILSNPTLWPLLWALIRPGEWSLGFCVACIAIRIAITANLQSRLTLSRDHFSWDWMAPLKDLLQTALWALAFAGNRVEWRGVRMRLRRDGTLAPL